MSQAGRERIVILGGGIAALAAAFELSRPGWQSRYENITVYQLGWRLGGKGASGRGRYGRIEEHGLHLWLGFYENAFRLMRDCYAELGRPLGTPLARWDEAFKKASFVVLEDSHAGTWKHWPIMYPEDAQCPGERPTAPPLTVWEYVKRAIQLLERLAGVRRPREAGGDQETAQSFLGVLTHSLRDLASAVAMNIFAPGVAALSAARKLATALPADVSLHKTEHHELLLRRLETFFQWWQRRAGREDDARRIAQLIEIVIAHIRGIVRDGLFNRPLETIDDWEYLDWLKHHGASEDALASPVLRGGYDLAFAYRHGDPSQPALAAGQALRFAMRFFFTYKGAIFWKMQAGMGDVVFAPLYKVLKRRGVQFRFFHRVKNLRLSGDRKSVSAIELARQVDLVDPSVEYDPLVEINGLPCWPAEPLYEQIRDGDRLRGYDLESFWAPPPDTGQITLKVREDFDRVLFGISLGAVPYVCGELVANSPGWRDMVANVETVQTQAFQIWLSADVAELGWTLPQADLSSYVKPFDTWADMRQLIAREQWPQASRPRGIGYFCSVMPTPPERGAPPDPSLPTKAAAQVKANAIAFLRRDVRHLWPGVWEPNTGDFRWDLLVGSNALGVARFDSQFWRANVNPSDRYVQSVPGSNRYRLKTNQTGYDNLYLVGDWIDCRFNAGCVEAAVMSGLLASNAISGSPPLADIVGYGHP